MQVDSGLIDIAEAIRSTASQDSWADPDHLVALASMAVAALSVVLTYLAQKKTNELTARTEHEKLGLDAAQEGARLALELRIKRLDEFYGRIQVQMGLSHALYQKLRANGPKPEGWSYLMNAEQVRQSPVDTTLMRQIIEANRVINEVIQTRGGLIREHDKLFTRFLTHFRLVESTFEKTAVPEAQFEDTYPEEFDKYINAECTKLREEIDEIDRELTHAREIVRNNKKG